MRAARLDCGIVLSRDLQRAPRDATLESDESDVHQSETSEEERSSAGGHHPVPATILKLRVNLPRSQARAALLDSQTAQLHAQGVCWLLPSNKHPSLLVIDGGESRVHSNELHISF